MHWNTSTHIVLGIMMEDSWSHCPSAPRKPSSVNRVLKLFIDFCRLRDPFIPRESSLKCRKVVHEYFDQQHAQRVPSKDLEKSPDKVFYLPIHIVYKESSTTTKIRAVFAASASSSSGLSLNSTLMIGPTVHPSLFDALIRFRSHRIAMIADVSRMYRAVLLAEPDKDLHRFVWRDDPKKPLTDYRMTCITFGVSASFIANMCVVCQAKCN